MDKISYHLFATILPKPEKVFFIDIKPEVAYERIIERADNEFEMFEKLEALQKIRVKGLELASLGKWLIVEGEKPVNEVELIIQNSLETE